MTMILNPNCSEIVWRLKGYRRAGRNEFIVDTSMGDAVEHLYAMTELLEEAKDIGKKKIDTLDIVYVDNEGGGGNWDYVEMLFKIAKAVASGKISSEKGNEIADKAWSGERDFEELEEQLPEKKKAVKVKKHKRETK